MTLFAPKLGVLGGSRVFRMLYRRLLQVDLYMFLEKETA
jgi:hypothetical protein